MNRIELRLETDEAGRYVGYITSQLVGQSSERAWLHPNDKCAFHRYQFVKGCENKLSQANNMVGFSHGFSGQGAHPTLAHQGDPYTKGSPYTKGTSIPRGHLHQEGPEADYSPRNKTRDKMPLKNLKITVTKVKQKVGSTN